tara:strand:+ start:192 stop:2183 length:1992 start_codon:yes stop_codon:yes gene_type:complete
MTTPSNTGWYFMSIPNDQSIRFYVQKTLDASNLDISLICVPLNKDVVRNANENEMTDISLSNFVSSLNYNDGPVENYGEFTVNDWGKLSIFDYDTKLSLPSGISSIPCWILLKNKVVPSLVIDTSLVNLKEYFGINFDPNTILNLDQELNRPTKQYVINKLYLNFPESTQIQKISYGGNITALHGVSNENIVYESIIHNHVYNEFDVNNNPIPDANLNDYYHYHWFDNYKYPTELYTADDLSDLMYHIRNKDWKGTLPAADDVKYDFTKMNNYSNTDTYLTVGDLSYGIASQPNVLVQNVNDNSWNYDLTTSMWEPDIWVPTGKTPSLINWMDISLGHKPLRWGPADRKEHLANKDENLEILQLILDTNSTGTIELSYGNDLDNQIYYQKLYVNQGEISMNLVRQIDPGLVINVSTGELYLKGPLPRKPKDTLHILITQCEFHWFNTSNGKASNVTSNKCGQNNDDYSTTSTDAKPLLENFNTIYNFENQVNHEPGAYIDDKADIDAFIENSIMTVASDGSTLADEDKKPVFREIIRDPVDIYKLNGWFTNFVFSLAASQNMVAPIPTLSQSSSDFLCPANETILLCKFKKDISFMKDYPPNQVYINTSLANQDVRNYQYYGLKENEYMFTPEGLDPIKVSEPNTPKLENEAGFFKLTVIEDI